MPTNVSRLLVGSVVMALLCVARRINTLVSDSSAHKDIDIRSRNIMVFCTVATVTSRFFQFWATMTLSVIVMLLVVPVLFGLQAPNFTVRAD